MVYAEQVSVKQRDTEEDLAKAEPAVVAAMAALDTLNKKASLACRVFSRTITVSKQVLPRYFCKCAKSRSQLKSSCADVVFLC